MSNLLYPGQVPINIDQNSKEYFSLFFNYNLSDEKYKEITHNAN